LLIGTHSINVVFMIGDTAMNSLRFPWFRIAYFLLWTGAFVNVQWLIHASISIWWPYPFLDLAFPKAPVWYDLLDEINISVVLNNFLTLAATAVLLCRI
jgi:hypothetical protein